MLLEREPKNLLPSTQQQRIIDLLSLRLRFPANNPLNGAASPCSRLGTGGDEVLATSRFFSGVVVSFSRRSLQRRPQTSITTTNNATAITMTLKLNALRNVFGRRKHHQTQKTKTKSPSNAAESEPIAPVHSESASDAPSITEPSIPSPSHIVSTLHSEITANPSWEESYATRDFVDEVFPIACSFVSSSSSSLFDDHSSATAAHSFVNSHFNQRFSHTISFASSSSQQGDLEWNINETVNGTAIVGTMLRNDGDNSVFLSFLFRYGSDVVDAVVQHGINYESAMLMLFRITKMDAAVAVVENVDAVPESSNSAAATLIESSKMPSFEPTVEHQATVALNDELIVTNLDTIGETVRAEECVSCPPIRDDATCNISSMERSWQTRSSNDDGRNLSLICNASATEAYGEHGTVRSSESKSGLDGPATSTHLVTLRRPRPNHALGDHGAKENPCSAAAWRNLAASFLSCKLSRLRGDHMQSAEATETIVLLPTREPPDGVVNASPWKDGTLTQARRHSQQQRTPLPTQTNVLVLLLLPVDSVIHCRDDRINSILAASETPPMFPEPHIMPLHGRYLRWKWPCWWPPDGDPTCHWLHQFKSKTSHSCSLSCIISRDESIFESFCFAIHCHPRYVCTVDTLLPVLPSNISDCSTWQGGGESIDLWRSESIHRRPR